MITTTNIWLRTKLPLQARRRGIGSLHSCMFGTCSGVSAGKIIPAVQVHSSAETCQHNNGLYLHVGPSGDFWTGHSIFAAKHLQPDYVKSIKLDTTIIDVDLLLELLEDDCDKWGRLIYDQASLPQELLDQLTVNKCSNDD